MSDLIAFLNARLDEDEETAALALRWWVEANAAAFVAVYTDTWQALDDYRPERALRDVEAKRATLNLYVRTLALTEHPPVDGGRSSVCRQDQRQGLSGRRARVGCA